MEAQLHKPRTLRIGNGTTGATWGRANDTIFIFGWIIPLNCYSVNTKREKIIWFFRKEHHKLMNYIWKDCSTGHVKAHWGDFNHERQCANSSLLPPASAVLSLYSCAHCVCNRCGFCPLGWETGSERLIDDKEMRWWGNGKILNTA